ncbi:hypothetical protein DFQ26_002748 [Actinomortierella ambigua]|nr:hypothetical protein DFQ26_002748 [Actinomortierella ambigua]
MNSLPGMNGPLIGNGPGYKNGDPIPLPILSPFTTLRRTSLQQHQQKVDSHLNHNGDARPLTNGGISDATSTTSHADPHGITCVTDQFKAALALGKGAAVGEAGHQPSPSPLQPSAPLVASPIQSTAPVPLAGAAVTATTAASAAMTTTIDATAATIPSTTTWSTRSTSTRGGADAGIVVVSGGTACNSLVQLLQNMTPNVTYVLGISDNGGSTSEILRVLDGPAIGDIRSRLIRLIRVDEHDIGRKAIQELLGYRLPGHGDENASKNEWVEIVEGSHRLWRHIPSEKKEVIRGFLIFVQSEILKRAHKRFSFANGSIGNLFLTGARMFFGSLESAVFLFAAITGVKEPTRVIPVINTNHGIAIAALLKNGHSILGQCAISHPSLATSGGFGSEVNGQNQNGGNNNSNGSSSSSSSSGHCNPFTSNGSSNNNCSGAMASSIDSLTNGSTSRSTPEPDLQALLSSSHQEDTFSTLKLTQNNIHFDKTPSNNCSLQSRITRLYYINEYGQEIFPPPNPKMLVCLAEMETMLYSIGSLYTSIIPCLILKDVGRGIAESRSLKNKIFMLNGSNDRETPEYTALDFVWAITTALNSSVRLSGLHWPREYAPIKYITHLIYLDNSEIEVDTWGIEKLGIECVPCKGKMDASGRPIYDEQDLDQVLRTIVDAEDEDEQQPEQRSF